MDNNQKFWVSMWGMAAATLVALCCLATYGSHNRYDKWEKAVSNGTDPMVAACALFTQGQVEAASCLLMAQNRK